MKTRASRRGAAVMWALVILSVLAVMMTLITRQGLTSLYLVERRQNQLQAEWLARSGVELAAARLLADPNGAQGETVELIPGGKVRITIQKQDGAATLWQVTAEARYPSEERTVVVRSATRSFRQVTEKTTTRLVVVPSP